MKKLWNRFTAWLSGCPAGRDCTNKKEHDIKQKVKETKPKGLKPKKKKKRAK